MASPIEVGASEGELITTDVLTHCVFDFLSPTDKRLAADVCSQWREAAIKHCSKRYESYSAYEREAATLKFISKFPRFRGIDLWLTQRELEPVLLQSDLVRRHAAHLKSLSVSNNTNWRVAIDHASDVVMDTALFSALGHNFPDLRYMALRVTVDHDALIEFLSTSRLSSLQEVHFQAASVALLSALVLNCPSLKRVYLNTTASDDSSFEPSPRFPLCSPEEINARQLDLHLTMKTQVLLSLCSQLELGPPLLHLSHLDVNMDDDDDYFRPVCNAIGLYLRPRVFTFHMTDGNAISSMGVRAAICFRRMLSVLTDMKRLQLHNACTADIPLLSSLAPALEELTISFAENQTQDDVFAQLAHVFANGALPNMTRITLNNVSANQFNVRALLRELPNMRVRGLESDQRQRGAEQNGGAGEGEGGGGDGEGEAQAEGGGVVVGVGEPLPDLICTRRVTFERVFPAAQTRDEAEAEDIDEMRTDDDAENVV